MYPTQDIREWCKQEQIIYQSFWTLTANKDALKSKPLVDISAAKKKTPAQVFYRFVMQEGIAPLCGTTDSKHMQQDLEVCNSFSLSNDEMAAIAKETYVS